MSPDRDDFIQNLVQDLTPVEHAGRTARLMVPWLLLSVFAAGLCLWLVQPFRPGWLQQLLQSPQFLLETLLGAAAIAALANLVFKLGIPGYPRKTLLLLCTLGLLFLWLSCHLAGLEWPALPASALGARAHCNLEVILYALPTLLFATPLLRRLQVLEPLRAGAVLGLCAGAIPAWLMQIACMYYPKHILEYHLAPVLLVVPLGMLLLWISSRWRKFH